MTAAERPTPAETPPHPPRHHQTRYAALVADLRGLADEWEGEAEWTESNFLPGPNSDTAAQCLREGAVDLRAVLDKHAGEG